jgi:signal transduction histidine kinase
MSRPPRVDLAIAAALAALGVAEMWLADVSGPRWLATTGAVLCAAPLAWRRSRPFAVQLACAAVITAEFLGGVDPNGPSVPLLVIVLAGYTLGERATAREALLGGALALAGTWLVVLTRRSIDPTDLGFTALVTLAPIVLGRLLGSSRRAAAAAAERAARAEHERERAVAAERSRIARELHDVVSHSISVMGIQAGAARRQLPPGHDDVRGALLAVEATGRDALAEMRRLLGVLRGDDGPLGLAPQPGIANLPELVDGVRRAGQPVELRLDVDGAPLAPGVELAAYRVVQEALTNVRKHAADAPAIVTVRRSERALELEVRDEGPGAGAAGGDGFGLVGMRERVALYGGELEVASPAGGGHVVRARLPLEAR